MAFRTEMITKNAVECRLCGDVVESIHRHDFVFCKCGEIAVDGGKDYLRRTAGNLNNIIDRSETNND
jgi:hypothetical protein